MAGATRSGLFLFKLSTRGEGVVAGDLDEVAGVVYGQDADVAAAAELEAIDAAVRGDEPRRIFGAAMDGSEQVEREKADGAGVRVDGDARPLMAAENVV